jgi:hypothetical protein
MQPSSPKRLDSLAIAFLAIVALMFVVGAVLGLRALFSQTAQLPTGAQPAAVQSLAALSEAARRAADELAARVQQLASGLLGEAPAPPAPSKQKAPRAAPQPPPKPATAGASDPKRAYPAIAVPPAPHVPALPANATWTYDVFFGPAWQKTGQLHYRTQTSEQGKLGARMSWTPNGGQTSNWFLGIFNADHASHANTRFPGFFMHPAYFPQTLAPGSRLLWEFPWQGGDALRQDGRVRRYDMRVVAWERVALPAGEFDAVRMEGKLLYVESESVKAEVAYALWYAPRAKQVVRLRWIGRAPDESSAEMIAELAAYHGP